MPEKFPSRSESNQHEANALGFIDAHCHLADPRIDGCLEEVLSRASERGIQHFVQGGVSPEDWERQLRLKERYPEQLSLCFGLHPWWVDQVSDEKCDEALKRLPQCLGEAVAVGELGLDHGPRTSESSHARQKRVFQRQLDIAQDSQKPLVLHIVHAHEQALEILGESSRQGPLPGGIVHAFTGPKELARRYIELGLTISLGSATARKGFERLKRGVISIPLQKIVIESDAPDQPTPLFEGKLNEPTSLWEVAEAVGKLKNLPAEAVLEQSRQNLIAIFGIGPRS